MSKRICINGHDTTIFGRRHNGCIQCQRDASQKWLKKYPHGQNDSRWKIMGIVNEDGSNFTHIDWERNFETQQGKCKICGIHQSEIKKTFHTDHDHITGLFRGLLCWNCNKSIGFYEKIKVKAELYLRGK